MSLVFENVTFGYRRSGPLILKDFSWQVPSGRTVLLGPNGAGKSTLLALGANALRPLRGRVVHDELNPQRRALRPAYRRTVGWMPQQIRPVPGLTVHEQVSYAAWLKGLSADNAWEAAANSLSWTGLQDLADHKATELSGGQLRRVGLAQVLAHDATVLLLDEPTAGLDPSQRSRFRELLAVLPPDKCVVVSTHQVDDLSELFDQVVVLETGMIRYSGSIAEFMSLAPSDEIHAAEVAYSQVISGDR